MSIRLRLVLFAVGLAVACDAAAGPYIVATGGAGGDSHATSAGLDLGWRGERLLLGAGMATLFTGGDWRTTSVTPITIFSSRKGDDLEFHGVAGWALAPKWVVLATAGSIRSTTIGRTTVRASGTSLEWDPEYGKARFAWSVQFQYGRSGLLAGAGYHNWRGVVGRVGVGVDLPRRSRPLARPSRTRS